MVPIVIEHRLHALSCAHCGETTRSPLPLLSVHPGGYGERLSAVVALLSGTYRQSHQQVKTCLAALFGIEMSTGSINRLRREVSEALAEAVIHRDETGFRQGNSDGQNAAKKPGLALGAGDTGGQCLHHPVEPLSIGGSSPDW